MWCYFVTIIQNVDLCDNYEVRFKQYHNNIPIQESRSFKLYGFAGELFMFWILLYNMNLSTNNKEVSPSNNITHTFANISEFKFINGTV